MKTWIVIAFLFLLSFFLRVYRIDSVPPSLNWDEVSIGYNAYSILKTGSDEWDNFMPLHFKSYGEFKLPVQIYSSIPGIALFGLSEFGVRITPVVIGSISVIAVYFLIRELFGDKRMAFIGALLLSISPWHLQLTRASFESSQAVLWIIVGTLFFLRGVRGSRFGFLLFFVSFALGIYSYNSARVFLPMFMLALGLIYRKRLLKEKQKAIPYAFLFLILMIPLAIFWFQGGATARLRLVSIVDDPGFVLRINEARGMSTLPDPLPRLLHNKVSEFALVFSGNYISHFEPNFLYISGASHKQHHPQEIGQFYIVESLFLLLGVYLLIRNKAEHRSLLFVWIFLGFIPAAVAIDSVPHALRTLLVLPAFIAIEAYGALGLLNFVQKKGRKRIYLFTVFLIIVAVGLQFSRYLNNYYTQYPLRYSRDWQYGYREVVEFIKGEYDNYDLIVFTRHYGEPHMFTLFYLGYPPDEYQKNNNLVRFETFNWVRVLRFDKFYFPDLGDDGTQYEDVIAANPSQKILFIGKSDDFPEEVNRLKKVDFLDGTRAFEAVEFNGR